MTSRLSVYRRKLRKNHPLRREKPALLAACYMYVGDLRLKFMLKNFRSHLFRKSERVYICRICGMCLYKERCFRFVSEGLAAY